MKAEIYFTTSATLHYIGVSQLCSKMCLLCYAAVLEKCTYHAKHLCLLCLIFFNYAHQNIHNNSNFAMISVIQLLIINIINFIFIKFSQSYDKILLIYIFNIIIINIQ